MSDKLRQRKAGSATASDAVSASSSSSSTSSSSDLSFIDQVRLLLDKDHDWDKAALLSALYWLRQSAALLLGPALGLLGVQGALGFGIAVAVLWLLMFAWYGKYLQVDVEEMGQWDLASEGMFPALALTLLLWIAFFSIDKH